MPANYNVSSWTAAENAPFEIELPSGAKCLARKLQMPDVVQLGLYSKLDSLSATVQEKHIDRVQGKKPQDRKAKKPTKAEQQRAKDEQDLDALRSLLVDKEKFSETVNVISDVVMTCVIAPKILDAYVNDPNVATADNPSGKRKLEPDERDPNAAYIDYVGLNDQMHIFSKVFDGMADLEKFRGESESGLGALADESSDQEIAG